MHKYKKYVNIYEVLHAYEVDMIPLIVAVILWGLANFLLKLARVSMDTPSVQAAQIVGVMIGVVFFYGFGKYAMSSFHGHAMEYVVGVLAGVCGFVGTYFFLYALGVEKLSFASQITSLHVVVATIFGVLFLKETLHVWEVIGGLLMIVGAILLGIAK
jgi:transporter family protein